MDRWKCRALFVHKNGLVDPNCVPFAPCWTVGFNSRFQSLLHQTEYVIDDGDYKTGKAVEAWVAENAGKRVVVSPSGEVMCEDETDANLLFLRFR